MGYGFGRGWGFGFRGTSPPWPYVGIGRGGLPRCGYYLSGAAWMPGGVQYSQPTAPSFVPAPTSADEINYLQDQAEMLRKQLEQIEARIREIEGETFKG